MGIHRALSNQDHPRRAWQTWWNMAGVPGLVSAGATYGTGNVTEALRNAASMACMDVLADAIGRIPYDVYRGTGAVRQPVVPTPPLIGYPSGVVLPDVWRNQLGWSLVTDGNAFGYITQYQRGWPATIELLDPYQVTERKVVDGVKKCKYGDEQLSIWPNGPIWHCPGRILLGGHPFGDSPVALAAKTIGTSLAAEDFSLGFFTDGGHPSSILYSSDPDLTEPQAIAAKEAWRRATAGTRETAVLGSNWKHEQIQINPTDSGNIDLMRFEVEQACRFWRVPPSMAYAAISGQNVTYANITDADVNYLKYSLDGYYVRIEYALSDALPRPQLVRLNRNAILRASPKERYETYAIQLANRQITVNEVRALEDLPPFGPEFDVPGIPPFAQAQPVGELIGTP